MLILLSCAKTMVASTKIKVPYTTTPLFQNNANEIALQMTQYSVDELEQILHVNAKLALANYQRFQSFHSSDVVSIPSILSYTGIVFKRLKPMDFNVTDFDYAQSHLRFTSFCYGLLRPLDIIRNYRLEGDVRLPQFNSETMFAYWKYKLTDLLIDDINRAGGVLCYLASDEMKGLFDWKKVEKSVRIITPQFSVLRNGVRKTIVVYTKMMRGEMTRFILKNQINDIEKLKTFEFDGFNYDPSQSDENNLVFTLLA